MPITRASTMTVVSRGLAARCPACGQGRVFRRGVESERACGVCGWRLERCPGHWIGGNEINLLATFPAGVLAFALAALAFGPGPVSVTIAVAASGAFSVAFYRPSRGLFFALDYLIDSAPDAASAPPVSEDDRGPPRRGPSPPRPSPDHCCGATPLRLPSKPASRSRPPAFLPPPQAPSPARRPHRRSARRRSE